VIRSTQLAGTRGVKVDPRGLPAIQRACALSTALWLRSLGGGVFAALRGGLVAAITQDWLQVGVAV